MQIVSIPCLQDNYAYLLICSETGAAAIIDPSIPEPVLTALESLNVEPVAILNTHHHWDHTGGNQALLQVWPELAVIGHHSDRGRIHGQNGFVEAGDQIRVGLLSVSILHNPGHTHGAISYHAGENLFTGDTLFVGGCGRTFEGTPTEMYTSLNRIIGTLPDQTRIYCGHEYTLRNLEFAQTVEPENGVIARRLAEVRAMRSAGEPTVPSLLALERATNPFLRCQEPAVRAYARQHAPELEWERPEAVFAVLRAAKDRF
jgi:hydroxyacylglutathione hydrolase